jgi:SNF family Na+-dependent transporter
MSQSKEQWTSRLGVILAVAGSAVGLGNFLRFPGQVAQNGGGAFMIPYFIALLLLGIPIGWAEWTMARHGGQKGFHSCPGIMGVIGRGAWARYLGVLGLLIPLVIYMYYVLIESWCLSYCFSYVMGWMDLGTDAGKYAERSGVIFSTTTGSSSDGLTVQGGLHQSVVFWVITFGLNFFILTRGIS